jgi:hypothetical protein
MFESKLEVEKVEMVKRIIRQNNYHHYEETHRQCVELGLNVNRSALDRFANKLELIDKAGLSKRQNELHQFEVAKQQASQAFNHHSQSFQQGPREEHFSQAQHPSQYSREDLGQIDQHQSSYQREKPKLQRHVVPKSMTYEQVKQRETEITFALGEIKIRESELLQELISLSAMLDDKQIN